MSLGSSGALNKDWRKQMTDERCVHKVFLTHRCPDCEAEESKDPNFQKDVKVFQLENELNEALERIKELEQELDEEKRKYKPDTTVEQMRETLRDSMLEHKEVITEQDQKITELKILISGYLDIFDSINYLPPDISGSHIRSMITKKTSKDDRIMKNGSDEVTYPDRFELQPYITTEVMMNEIDDEPTPMIIWCPECSKRHIDVGEFETKPHHTHACQHCGHVWRPAIVNTVGVQFLPGFKN